MTGDLDARKAMVRAKCSLVAAIERHVKLSGSAGSVNRRGKCPFHNGNSPSFSVKARDGYAHCFGCQWHGDVIGFTADIHGLSFIDALRRLEGECGVRPAAASTPSAADRAAEPVRRERYPAPAREREWIEPIGMARWIWGRAKWEPYAIARYFEGRGIPATIMADQAGRFGRLASFRYLDCCPVQGWEAGKEPKGVMVAPAIVAMVVEPPAPGETLFKPVGVHVTYLNPEGTGTMVRRKPWAKPDDEDPLLPKRRMLGPVGRGAVLLGEWRGDARLWVGEGNETVLSGMALHGAAPGDVGVATLSLDNLQGMPRLWQGKLGPIWPLHDMRPDPERRGCFAIPGQRGRVTVLVDADMSPLRGPKNQATGEPIGESVVERKGGPIVRRAITGAERARICAELAVKGWRAAGAMQVDALRPRAGLDFNDAIRERAG